MLCRSASGGEPSEVIIIYTAVIRLLLAFSRTYSQRLRKMVKDLLC